MIRDIINFDIEFLNQFLDQIFRVEVRKEHDYLTQRDFVILEYVFCDLVPLFNYEVIKTFFLLQPDILILT